MKIAAVVPAYNEEGRIGVVLEVLKQSTLLDEIVVVSDGSSDRTYEVARGIDGVKAIRLETNLGKGGAMEVGASATDADVIVFFDADLIGLKPEHVDALVKPLADSSADMSIGIFCGGRARTDWAQKITPYISGQRALKRSEFLEVPDLKSARFGVEIAIGHYARSKDMRVVRVSFPGVTHPLKEEKLGFLIGTAARTRMYWEIIKLVLGTSKSARKLKQTLGLATDRRPES